MTRNPTLATVAGFVCLAATITVPTIVHIHNGTVRETACVEAGGSYVLTASGSGRECQQ
jgi:hypothetical protein